MPETPPPPAALFRGRLGPDSNSGFYAAPDRYELHLSRACPDSLRLAVLHGLLGLDGRVRAVFHGPMPDTPGGYAALRDLYEATHHRYAGVADVPVLADRWSGRIVSAHTPDIMRDLAVHFADGAAAPFCPGGERETGEVAALCAHGIDEAAQRAGAAPGDGRGNAGALAALLRTLRKLERRLTGRPFVLGDHLTLADVHLWVALVQLDTVHRWHLDAEAVHRVAAHPRVWGYARRLLAVPAFASALRTEDIALRHHHRCRGKEAAGAAVQIIDWSDTRAEEAEEGEQPASARVFGVLSGHAGRRP